MRTAATPEDVPEDLRFPADFTPAPLDDVIRVARKVVQQWREQNEDKTRRQYGDGAMHPITYARGLHARRSLLHILLHLKAQQETSA